MAMSQAERGKLYRLKHPERVRAANILNMKKRFAADPEKVRKTQRQWCINNPIKVRKHQLKIKYGITLEDFITLLIEQDGRCAICKSRDRGPEISWAVDHDHKTGKVRGLLCSGCNHGVGNFKDNPDLLIAAANYLTK